MASVSASPGATTGVVTGTLAPTTQVVVTSAPGAGYPYTYTGMTDATGFYVVSGIRPGSYVVYFQVPTASGYLAQYVPQQAGYYQAGVFTVRAGEVTTVSDTPMPTGVITGRVLDETGTSTAQWVMADSRNPSSAISAMPAADGTYSMSVFAGTYTVQFAFGVDNRQYAYRTTDINRAERFVVNGGETVVVNDTLLPTGTVTGRILERDGTPAVGVGVALEPVAGGAISNTRTSADGTYAFTSVTAGDYRLRLSSTDYLRAQYVPGKLTADDAGIFTLVGDQTLTVDEQFLPTGTVAVNAIDAVTGLPVSDLCFDLLIGNMWRSACSNGNGVSVVTDVPQGAGYILMVRGKDEGTYLEVDKGNVTIIGGTVTTVTLTLTPSAVIEAAVVDAATGAAVPNVCMTAVAQRGGSVPEYLDACTDEQGRTRIGRLAAGSYNVFVAPHDGVHGAQWVGANGGTGNQFGAALLTVAAGQSVAAPVIRLDGAGSIAGAVTDETTGAPIAYACVSVTAESAGHGRTGSCSGAYTDEQGNFALTDLGPYAWPVEFAGAGYAWEWSGNAINRKQATPVAVTVGAVATSSAALGRGRVVTGRVLDSNGALVSNASVSIFSVESGDAVGDVGVMENGTYSVNLAAQKVKIYYNEGMMAGRTGWYRHATSFETATVVKVRTKDVALDLTMP